MHSAEVWESRSLGSFSTLKILSLFILMQINQREELRSTFYVSGFLFF